LFAVVNPNRLAMLICYDQLVQQGIHWYRIPYSIQTVYTTLTGAHPLACRP
jgi:hypothetical protein